MLQELAWGQTKLEAARAALTQHWRDLETQPHIGLRALGHRTNAADEDSCRDTELLIPLAQGQEEELFAIMGEVEARGMSPLSEALREVTSDFSFLPERTNAVIMIADGSDDCGEDPCQRVKLQREADFHLPIYVVGLSVRDTAREQLLCLAEASEGIYRDAASESELLLILEEFVHHIESSSR
jgi:Ca-activated chloride channel family protein